jgi:hypothetical protein
MRRVGRTGTLLRCVECGLGSDEAGKRLTRVPDGRATLWTSCFRRGRGAGVQCSARPALSGSSGRSGSTHRAASSRRRSASGLASIVRATPAPLSSESRSERNYRGRVFYLERALEFIALVAVLRLVFGFDLDGHFVAWAFAILLISGVLVAVGPLLDKACEAEDRFWGSLARRVRSRRPARPGRLKRR